MARRAALLRAGAAGTPRASVAAQVGRQRLPGGRGIVAQQLRDGEEVIAAGDAPNDLELFAFAGLSVAPRDAHPDVLARADATIPPPAEDGIAELVARYLSQDVAPI